MCKGAAKEHGWASQSGTKCTALVAGFFMRSRMGGMKYRKLRIAWSVAWGVVAVLLCVWWVRSYWWWDGAGFDAGSLESPLGVGSIQGRIEAIYIPRTPVTFGEWKQQSYGITNDNIEQRGSALGAFSAIFAGGGYSMIVPHWFLFLFSAMLSIVPWLRQLSWRFSLRTLLIITTLVAVVLGLAVWAART